MKHAHRILPFVAALLPASVALAADAPDNIADLIGMATGLVNPIIKLLTGLAVIAFIWGIVQYIFYAGDEKKKKSAKNTMVYGVIALFVLFSFWGIVDFIKVDIFGN